MATARSAALLLLLVAAAVVLALPPEPEDRPSGSQSSTAAMEAMPAFHAPRPTRAQLNKEAAAWRLTSAQAKAIGEPHGAGKIRICISPYTPGVKCSYTDHTQASGYQVELFKAIAANVSWLNANPWYFSCLRTTDMIDGLVDPPPNGSCMIAPCNIIATPQLMARGVQPSAVIDKDGLLIMVRKTTNDGLLLWAPFLAFSWEVWLMLVLTGILVGTIIVGCDIFSFRSREESRTAKRRQLRLDSLNAAASFADHADSDDSFSEAEYTDATDDGDSLDGSAPPAAAAAAAKGAEAEPSKQSWYDRWFVMTDTEYEEWRQRLRTNTRRSVLRVVGMADSPISKTVPAQIVLWGFGLLLMLITGLYTASSAAIFTKARMVTSVKSLDDLRGRAVGTWTPYTQRLRDLGIAPTPFPWDDEEDEAVMLDKLSDGTISALVIDAPFVRSTVSHKCEFVAVGTPFSLADHGYGYNSRLSANLTQDMNRAIRVAIMDRLPEEMFNKYVKGGDCPDQLQEAKASSIQLRQVGGLWLALAIGMVFGTLLLGLKYLHRRPMLKLKHVVGEAALQRAQEARSRGECKTAGKGKFVLKGGLKKRPRAGDGGHHNDTGC